MTDLMSQYLYGILRCSTQRQGNIRAENADQAGTWKRVREIDGQGMLYASLAADGFILLEEIPGNGFDPVGSKPHTEMNVAEKKPGGHKQHTDEPDFGQSNADVCVFHVNGQTLYGIIRRPVFGLPEHIGDSFDDVPNADLDLSCNRTNARVCSERGTDFMNQGIDQGKRQQQADGNEQPSETQRTVAECFPEKTAQGYHQENGDDSHDIGFDQKIVKIGGTHEQPSLCRHNRPAE